MPPDPLPGDLYPRLLGDAWGGLPEPVRRIHCGGSRRAAGLFDVRHGRGPARWLARVLGMPRAGEGIPTRLAITTARGGERWDRRFGDDGFVTEQDAGDDGRLRERFGPVELRLDLRAAGGALRFEPAGAYLRVGRHAVPIPGWLAPRVSGGVTAEGERARVEVEVKAPFVGLLVRYSGWVALSEAPA